LNIVLRELKANLKSLLIWCGVMILLVFIGAAKFSAFYGDPTMLTMLDAMPKAMIDAFSLRAFNLTTLVGYQGILFVYFALMGGIAAALWASDSISKEERDKTVEFSLVLPVSRSRVITAKIVAVVIDCIIFVAVTWVSSIIAAQQFKPDAVFSKYLTLQMIAMFVIELIFLAMGLLLGCAMKQYKRAGSLGIAIILVAYFFSIVTGMQKSLDFLKYFTPFKYFDPVALLKNGTLDGGYLLLSAAIIVVCVAAAYWSYNRRDLYI